MSAVAEIAAFQISLGKWGGREREQSASEPGGGDSSASSSVRESFRPPKSEGMPLMAFALCRSGRDGDTTPLFLGVSSQLTLGTAEMSFWDQGIPKEALVISCPLCYSTHLTLGLTGELFLFS